MADARTLSVTYSSDQGRARPLPWVQAPALFTTGRALPPSSRGAALALPHPDKPCSYHERGRSLFDRAGALRSSGLFVFSNGIPIDI
jgi:hypothetical protein